VHFGGVNEKIDVGCEGFLAEKELFAGSWSECNFFSFDTYLVFSRLPAITAEPNTITQARPDHDEVSLLSFPIRP
jgi:hypothetical protein